MKHKLFAFVFSFALVYTVFGQQPFIEKHLRWLNYVFPADSLAGFDQNAADQTALHRGFFGMEYKVIMYTMKRDFINKKYGYSKGVAFGSLSAKNGNPSVMGLPCNNEDFESSAATTGTTSATAIGTTLAGWTVSQGQNSGFNGSCTLAGCCPTAGSSNAWVRTTPWTDPNAGVLGVIGASPLGGTKILQMNDNIPITGEMVEIQQTFPVTSANALFQMAYLASLNGASHACCDQPFMTIKVVDCMNNPLACPSLSVTPPGAACVSSVPSGWTTNGSGISYTTSWQRYSIDLTPYIGSCVTIQVIASDCDGWAHHGMAYVDFLCSPMNILVNTVLFPAGPPVVAVTACGVTTASMSAPGGMGPYLWNGPSGSGVTNNANQTVTTTVAGNYTLTMTPPGICAPITKTISLSFGTFPTGGFTRSNSCTTYTLTNTGAASPAVQTYSFVGPGAPPSYTNTNSNSVVNLAPSTTYTIYQTVTNSSGCPTTTSVVITTPAGPSPAFTAASSFTQCLNGNAFTFSPTTASGTHTYNFVPTTGAPASGFTANYGPVSFTSPGTYTVLHTCISGGCTVATTSVVTINSTPTISIASGTTPGCAGGTGTLVGTGGPGSLTWTGPNSYTAVGGGTTSISNFQTTSQGVYTLTANNNGCISTRTVDMTMPAQPSATVTNTGPYCQGATIVLNAALNTTVGLSGTQFWSPWCCWSTCCSGYSAAVTPTATTSSSGVYYFYAWFTNGCYAYVSTSVTVNSCVLPIELSSFGSTCLESGTLLDWETASEKNNLSFTILRSEDGHNYTPVGTVPGQGNSEKTVHYEFIDERTGLNQNYYYRLRQTETNHVDNDVGSPLYSRCGKKITGFEVFPNPASNELKLISDQDITGATIEILNSLGEKVKILADVSLDGGTVFTINSTDLCNGCYQIIIYNSDNSLHKKFIIYK